MTSKTFNSAHEENSYQQLNIAEVDAGIRISVDHNSHGVKGVIISPSDAPALALAILEAAGYTASPNSSFNIAASYLINGIKEQERITAEAEAQAELEAEAFNLYRAYMTVHEPMNAIGDWQRLAEGTKEEWLAVARKAREMAKEATK